MISLKKIFVIGYILVSLGTISFAYDQGEGVIVGNNVNVRKQASKNSSVLFRLPKNKAVKVLDKSSDWYKISYNNKIGWISDDFIKVSKNDEKTVTKEPTKADNSKENIKKIIGNNVNIRAKSTTNSTIIAKAKTNQKVTVITTGKEWSKIKIGNKIGWITNKYLEKNTAEKLVDATKSAPVIAINGVIKGNDVNIRKNPTRASSVIAKIDSGKSVKILETNNEWTKISTVATSGWVSSKYVSNSIKATSRGDNTLRDTSSLEYNSGLASKIIETGKDYMGTNYVYGGTTPRGFDCSGFIGYIMKKNDIDLPRTSAEQATVGEHVDRDDLKPGDLIFFDTDGGKNHVSHVGMYIGEGRFIHASSGGDGEVKISSLSEHFYSVTYMTARRVIK